MNADPTPTTQAIHWVFAYGSLMWDPQIPVVETALAHLHGYARSFCLLSVCYRGTEENPGLVLGLDEDADASCAGVALGVADVHWAEALAELRARELVTNAYAERWVTLSLADGREVEAVAYVMQPTHPQYAGNLSAVVQADMIARAHGDRGPNADYLFSTVAHLDAIGVQDQSLADLAIKVRDTLSRGSSSV